MSNKTFRIVLEEKEKQERHRKKELDEEVEYVDNARNISVVLDSGDLAKDFESHGLDAGVRQEDHGPNSKMFHRLAKYYASKKEIKLAMDALEDAQRLAEKAKEKDYSMYETEAKLHLSTGNYLKALKCAEKVLWQEEFKTSQTAIYVKSQALYNLCDFEHALIMFYQGRNN